MGKAGSSILGGSGLDSLKINPSAGSAAGSATVAPASGAANQTSMLINDDVYSDIKNNPAAYRTSSVTAIPAGARDETSATTAFTTSLKQEEIESSYGLTNVGRAASTI